MATPFATPRARALGFGLRKCREDKDVGVRQLAKLVGVHAQEVSNWEYAKRVPRVEQVALVMGVLVVEPGERARLLELARTAAEPSWLEKVMPGAQEPDLRQYEREASDVRVGAGAGSRAVADARPTRGLVLTGLGVPGEMVERRAMARQARRGLLTGPQPVPLRGDRGRGRVAAGVRSDAR